MRAARGLSAWHLRNTRPSRQSPVRRTAGTLPNPRERVVGPCGGASQPTHQLVDGMTQAAATSVQHQSGTPRSFTRWTSAKNRRVLAAILVQHTPTSASGGTNTDARTPFANLHIAGPYCWPHLWCRFIAGHVPLPLEPTYPQNRCPFLPKTSWALPNRAKCRF
jgi:hypothetical protein